MTLGALGLFLAFPPAVAVAVVAASVAAWCERRAGGHAQDVVLRAAIAGLLGLALARPSVARGVHVATAVLADRSASVDSGVLAECLAALGVPRADVPVLSFGTERDSSLAHGIDRAVRSLPEGGRVIVVTDGRATDPDPMAAAARAARAGVQVDVVAVPAGDGSDALVAALDVPAAWRAGDDLPIAVAVRASAPVSSTLVLSIDGRPVARVPMAIDGPGDRPVYETAVHLGGAGLVRVEAVLDTPGDVDGDDARAAAVVMPAAPLSVLVVGDDEGAVALADRLSRQGVRATVLGTAVVPGRLSALAAWDVLVLADVSARDLGVDQVAAIEAFASDLGRGVVFTGGRQSYSAGAWRSTALERMLPGNLEPPSRDVREPVALLLLVDQSASMGTADGRTGVSKLDLAREAAVLASEVLHTGDTVGVVTYDDSARWFVPWLTVGGAQSLADVQADLARLVTGGGTRILAALELGLPALGALPATTRHAVLLSDGRDFDPDATRYDAVVRAARDAGATLSTIAVGFDADRELLARLARLGHGRYHEAEDPSDLPRLAVAESEIARAGSERSGTFRARATGTTAHPALSGIDLAALPPLEGYLALTSRAGADVVLETSSGDPLLSTWQYGLGRVAAWTSDLGEAWAGAWAGHAAGDAFWRRVVGYVARAPGADGPVVRYADAVNGREARVTVDISDAAGSPLDLADVALVVTDTHAARRIDLVQESPGRYAAALPTVAAPSEAAVAITGADGRTATWPAPIPWRQTRERLTVRAVPLDALASAGGGRVIAELELATALPSERPARVGLWPWLVGFAAALWPVSIARQLGRSRSRRTRRTTATQTGGDT